MKTLKFLFASALVIAAAAAYGQDTTRVSNEAAKDKTGPGVGAQGQNVGDRVEQELSEDYTKDMTVIESSEVPASLRSTLQGEQYKGWEGKSKIYRSKNNDSYVVEIRDGDETKVHRFDQNGKAVKDY